MIKKLLVPVMLAALLAACGSKQEEAAPAAAAPAPAPAAATAPAPVPAEAAATVAAAPQAADNAAGEKVFKATCAMCHAAGVAGAPKPGDKADWGPRIAQGKDTLYTHALKGFNGSKGSMPPKGGNASLADADVQAAVDYMVSKSQ